MSQQLDTKLQTFISELLNKNEDILPKIALRNITDFQELDDFLDSNQLLENPQYALVDIQLLKKRCKQIQIINQMKLAEMIDHIQLNINGVKAELLSLQKDSEQIISQKEAIISAQKETIQAQKETLKLQKELKFQSIPATSNEDILFAKEHKIAKLTDLLQTEKEKYAAEKELYLQHISDLQQRLDNFEKRSNKIDTKKIKHLEKSITDLRTKEEESNHLISILEQKIQTLQDSSEEQLLQIDELLEKLKEYDNLKQTLHNLEQNNNNEKAKIDLLSSIIVKLNSQLEIIRTSEKTKLQKYIQQEIWNRIVIEDLTEDTSFSNTENELLPQQTSSLPHQCMKELGENVTIHYESINIRNHIESQFQNIVSQICPSDDTEGTLTHVYIDTQGGARDNSVVLTAIMEILKSSHADTTKLEQIYATHFTPGKLANEIHNKTNIYQVFDLVTGINEFLTHMHITKLRQHFEDRLKYIKKLVLLKNCDSDQSKILDKCYKTLEWWTHTIFNDLTNFSNCMFLCNIDSAENSLRSLHNTILEFDSFHKKSIAINTTSSSTNTLFNLLKLRT